MRSGFSLYSRRSLNFRALRWRPGNIFSMREKSVPKSLMACTALADVRLLINTLITAKCSTAVGCTGRAASNFSNVCYYSLQSTCAGASGHTVDCQQLTLKKSSVSWGVHLSLLIRLE